MTPNALLYLIEKGVASHVPPLHLVGSVMSLKSYFTLLVLCFPLDFPGGSDGKASAYNAGDQSSIPEYGRSPGEGNGNSLLSWKIPWTEEPGRLQSIGS